MPRKNCAMHSAMTIKAKDLVFTSQNRGKAQSPRSAAPAMNTGRRPTRSETADIPTIATASTAAEIRTAASIVF
jgi:hypothetical protein